MAASDLPTPVLDSRKQGAARLNISERTFIRLEERGMPFIRIGRIKRYDPAQYLPWVRGELPPPVPPRRGRPRKRDSATASPTAATTAARPPKLRLRHRTRGSL